MHRTMYYQIKKSTTVSGAQVIYAGGKRFRIMPCPQANGNRFRIHIGYKSGKCIFSLETYTLKQCLSMVDAQVHTHNSTLAMP